MRFFVIREPDFERAAITWEGVVDADNCQTPFRLPPVICEVCGKKRVYGRRMPWLAVPGKTELRNRLQSMEAMHKAEFRELCHQIREDLGLTVETELLPGTEIGPLHVPFRRAHTWPDFLPGISIWPIELVSPKVKDVFERFGITGYKLCPIVAHLPSGSLLSDVPAYQECVFTGRVGKLITNPEYRILERCVGCGRQRITDLTELRVNEALWDGSDFCKADGPPGDRMVTERVVEAVHSAGLTGVKFVPLERALLE